jgi:hypothetical protein
LNVLVKNFNPLTIKIFPHIDDRERDCFNIEEFAKFANIPDLPPQRSNQMLERRHSVQTSSGRWYRQY